MALPRQRSGVQGCVSRRLRSLAWVVTLSVLAGCTSEPAASIGATPRPSSSLGTTPATTPTASGETELTWLYGELGYQTSVLHVPLDYTDPLGEQIPIALGRRVATDPGNRIGTLVYLPGGPGDDGVEALRTGADVLFTDEVRERFDIVAFDARGNPANALGPTIECPLDDGLPDIAGDPRIATGLGAFVTASSEQLADACGSASGEILPLVGTANVIGDIDRLREALGEEQLSFIGISYGTLTGLRYAERYPEHVRALILDAPVDPALDEVGWGRASVLTLQRLFDEFLAACAADEACAIHGDRRPRETFETLVTRLSVAAVEGVSAKSLWDVLYSGLRQPDQLDEWLAEIRDGDMTSTKAMLQNAADPDSVGYSLGVACADVEHPSPRPGSTAWLTSCDLRHPTSPGASP